ncbi:MAG: antibiotic biosynthesis monooxygenase [Chitinophagales bacterium]|nr:antibiotic biosynthesis monooxygenase [Chitinophagales bacterium]
MTNTTTNSEKGFVAINYIECSQDYVERFEELFSTRARAIDALPGFRNMYVLKPTAQQEKYLIVSHWDSENEFKAWTRSAAFLEGHKRGFEDVRKAKEAGLPPPMHSDFKTYSILTN